MLKKTLILDEAARFHSQPAAMIASAAQRFDSLICFSTDRSIADCKKVISIMNLILPQDRILEIIADGSDEQEAISEIEYIIKHMYWR